MEGYVVTVLDGRTFDLQPVGPGQSSIRLTLGLIEVPDIGSCEGTAARALFASLIAGKLVSIDSAGILTVGDIPDVGLTMIQYGYAAPSASAPGYYVEDSKLATPFSCANTTTTAVPVVVVQPRPTRPRPKPTRTPAVTEPTPIETPAPEPPPETTPVAQPPREEPPATPRTPETPRTPDTPAPPASG